MPTARSTRSTTAGGTSAAPPSRSCAWTCARGCRCDATVGMATRRRLTRVSGGEPSDEESQVPHPIRARCFRKEGAGETPDEAGGEKLAEREAEEGGDEA